MAVYETCACAAGSVLLKNKKTTIHHGGPKTLPLDAAKLKKVPPPPPPPPPPGTDGDGDVVHQQWLRGGHFFCFL